MQVRRKLCFSPDCAGEKGPSAKGSIEERDPPELVSEFIFYRIHFVVLVVFVVQVEITASWSDSIPPRRPQRGRKAVNQNKGTARAVSYAFLVRLRAPALSRTRSKLDRGP